jgi:predicted membrane protein
MEVKCVESKKSDKEHLGYFVWELVFYLFLVLFVYFSKRQLKLVNCTIYNCFPLLNNILMIHICGQISMNVKRLYTFTFKNGIVNRVMNRCFSRVEWRGFL